MPTRLYSVVFDAADPPALARFWSTATGWPITYEARDEVVVEPPEDAAGRPTEPGLLPSIHSGEWDPFFAACQDTQTTMHIGSSSRMPATSSDAPRAWSPRSASTTRWRR